MGATLGHLFVYTFNLTKKEQYTTTSSIDFGVADPAIKANTVVDKYEDMLKYTSWQETDLIVRIVMIGAIDGKAVGQEEGAYPMRDPYGFVFLKPDENAEDKRKYGVGDEVDLTYVLSYGMSIDKFDLEIQSVTVKDVITDIKDFVMPASILKMVEEEAAKLI